MALRRSCNGSTGYGREGSSPGPRNCREAEARGTDAAGTRSRLWAAANSLRGPVDPPTSRRTSSRCCSTSASPTPGTTSTPAVTDFGATSRSRSRPTTTASSCPRGATGGPAARSTRTSALPSRTSSTASSRPTRTRWRASSATWRGATRTSARARPAQPHRGVPHARPEPATVGHDVLGQRLRVPAQAVRRRVGQEGGRVLHAALASCGSCSASSTRSRPTPSTTRPAARAGCSSRRSTRCCESGGVSRQMRFSGRRSASPPPPSPG